MPDIYIVMDGARVVGASTRLQGAENIRADEARKLVRYEDYAGAYDRMTIVNTELMDT